MKKSVKIIIAIVAVLIVLGGIAAGIFFSGLFDYLKPTRKAWQSQVAKALSLDKVKLTEYSETLEDYKEVIQKPFTANLEISANVSIPELDKDVQKVINNSKLKIETASIPSELKGQVKYTLESDNTKILDLDMVANKTKIGIGSSDLYDKYLTYSLEDIEDYADETARSYGLDTSTAKSMTASEEITKSLENFSKINIYDLLYIPKNDLKDIDKTYKKAFNDSIDKDCYTKKANVEVEVDGKDVGTTAYYLTLNGEDSYELIKGFAEATKNSSTIKNLITDKANMLLEAVGEDKINSEQVQEMLDEMYMSYDLDQMDEIWADYKEEMLKEMRKSGIQIAVYSKFSKPVRLEFNIVEDMDDIYNVKTLMSIEYAKKKDIYTINISEENTVRIIDEYEKKTKDTRKGTLSVEVQGAKLVTIDYEFVNKKAEKKLALSASAPLLGIKLSLDISAKGDITKEPVDISMSLEGSFQNKSAKIMINGTIDFSKEVSIPTLDSKNSVNVFKLTEKEGNELIEKIAKNASEVLPARLKKLGINVDAKDIYNPNNTLTKPTIPTTTIPTISGITTKTDASTNSNKLIAKNDFKEDGIGDYSQTIEVEFKDNKVSSITITAEFKDAEAAKTVYDFYKSENPSEDVKQNGKSVTIKNNIDEFAKSAGVSKDKLTRDYMKTLLENEGYEIVK